MSILNLSTIQAGIVLSRVLECIIIRFSLFVFRCFLSLDLDCISVFCCNFYIFFILFYFFILFCSISIFCTFFCITIFELFFYFYYCLAQQDLGLFLFEVVKSVFPTFRLVLHSVCSMSPSVVFRSKIKQVYASRLDQYLVWYYKLWRYR